MSNVVETVEIVEKSPVNKDNPVDQYLETIRLLLGLQKEASFSEILKEVRYLVEIRNNCRIERELAEDRCICGKDTCG